MSKITVGFMVVMLSMTMVSAKPMNQEFFEHLLTSASQVLHSLAEKDPSGMMKQFLAPMKGIFDRFMNRSNREKRAIKSDYVATKANETHFQRVELHSSWDKDPQQKPESACLIQENEIHWLNYMASVLIALSQEMKKVLDGKQIPVKMSKNAYEQRKANA